MSWDKTCESNIDVDDSLLCHDYYTQDYTYTIEVADVADEAPEICASEQPKYGDELLIDLIRQHPWLYNKQLPEYKDSGRKENAWEQIATIMSKSVTDCQNRWLRLRQYYAKERQIRGTELRSGTSPPKRKQWEMFETMSFLEPHVSKRKGFSNIPPVIPSKPQQNSGTPTNAVITPNIISPGTSSASSRASTPSSMPSNYFDTKRKKTGTVDPVETVFKQLNSTIETMADKLMVTAPLPLQSSHEDADSDELIGKLVTAELKTTCEPRKAELKKKIMTLLYSNV